MDDLKERIAQLEKQVIDLSRRLAEVERRTGAAKVDEKPALRSRGMLDRPKPR